MKIIEAMKEIERLEAKTEDLKQKIGTYCADIDIESPVYPDQAGQVREWLQSAHDSLKESERLRLAIQRTNLSRMVEIEVGGVRVEKPIAAWIIRRRLYAQKDQAIWSALSDRNLKDANYKKTSGENLEVKVRRYYDPKLRDTKVSEYRDEPGLIDRTLEVINAVTDIQE